MNSDYKTHIFFITKLLWWSYPELLAWFPLQNKEDKCQSTMPSHSHKNSQDLEHMDSPQAFVSSHTKRLLCYAQFKSLFDKNKLHFSASCSITQIFQTWSHFFQISQIFWHILRRLLIKMQFKGLQHGWRHLYNSKNKYLCTILSLSYPVLWVWCHCQSKQGRSCSHW